MIKLQEYNGYDILWDELSLSICADTNKYNELFTLRFRINEIQYCVLKKIHGDALIYLTNYMKQTINCYDKNIDKM